MERGMAVILLGFIAIIIGTIFCVALSYSQESLGEKEIVKCYDRYDNEIIGQLCYEYKLPSSITTGVTILMMVGALILLIGFFLFLHDSIREF